MRHGQTRFIVGFLALPLLLYVVFVISPYLQAVQISFTDWTGYTSERNFIGFDNYIALFQDQIFLGALGNNLIFLLIMPPVVVGLALFLATITSIAGGKQGRVGPIQGSKFYQIVFFFPQILPVVMVAILFQFAFNPRIGIVNGFLSETGLGHLTRSWLGDPGTALWAVMSVMIWAGVGFYVVLFTAAIQAIPKDYFEAAQLDGAGRFRTFFHVTLPMLRETVQTGWVFVGMGALDMFTLVAVLTPDGGPSGSTEVISTYMQRVAFLEGRFGYGAAIGVALCLITLLFALATFRLTRRERLEY